MSSATKRSHKHQKHASHSDDKLKENKEEKEKEKEKEKDKEKDNKEKDVFDKEASGGDLGKSDVQKPHSASNRKKKTVTGGSNLAGSRVHTHQSHTSAPQTSELDGKDNGKESGKDRLDLTESDIRAEKPFAGSNWNGKPPGSHTKSSSNIKMGTRSKKGKASDDQCLQKAVSKKGKKIDSSAGSYEASIAATKEETPMVSVPGEALKKLQMINQGEKTGANEKSALKFITSAVDIGDEEQNNPLRGLFDRMPCTSLQQAVAPLVNIIPNIQDHVKIAFEFVAKTFPDAKELTDGYAALNLYTQEWDPPENSLYYILNDLLRNSKDGKKYPTLKNFFSYLSLIFATFKQLPKKPGFVTVFRGVNLGLSEIYVPNSRHTWYPFTSCATIADGIVEFMEKRGSRTLFAINTYKVVAIAPFSLFPSEAEILLLPGTHLKVLSVVNLGSSLHLIQMEEIPSRTDLEGCLVQDKQAIDFWSDLSNDSFTAPLDDFCDSILQRSQLPVIKKLDISIEKNERRLEAFQKYWTLWYFAGGSMDTFNYYVDPQKQGTIPQQEASIITLEKFGLLLCLGDLKKFLDELYGLVREQKLFPDTMTGTMAGQYLEDASQPTDTKSRWILRCSPKRDFPFTLSYFNLARRTTSHARIGYSEGTYSIIINKQRASATSLNGLISRVITDQTGETLLGEPVLCKTLELLFKKTPNNYYLPV